MSSRSDRTASRLSIAAPPAEIVRFVPHIVESRICGPTADPSGEIDPNAIAAWVIGLSSVEAETLLRLLSATPLWMRRKARLSDRDDLIRRALTPYAGWRPCRAAKHLAEDLRTIAASDAQGARPDLLRQIVALSGKPIGWRSILNAARAMTL